MKFKVIKGLAGYATLNHLPFNRDYSLRSGLVKSMKKNGFIDPIKLCWSTAINGVRTLYILDGQHRALAAQYLNIEFYGIIIEEEPTTKERLVELTATYNNSSVAWKIAVYVAAYISLNYDSYLTLNKLAIENGFSHKIVGTMLRGKLSDGGSDVANEIKQGSFKITNLVEAKETLLLTRQLGNKMNNSMLLSFHRIRLMDSSFDFNTFKLAFNKNYEELVATSYRLYDDVFSSWLR
jgi:hypothetical protein